MSQKTMHIGLDDTDSPRTGCTTYVAALLLEKLQSLPVKFTDYPNLIRLNPNVPWTTRGNGALCFRISYDKHLENEIRETVLSTLENNSDFQFEGTDPGVVFLEKKRVPLEIRRFSKRAITGIVTLKEALRLLKKHRGEAVGFKNGRGIIGALAAVGETLQGDHTYEILTYRIPENYVLKRRVDEASIFKMDEATAPCTFNNVDAEKHRVIITPRGPDPILFGIRGENPETLKKAFTMVKAQEPIERWAVFRTNQGTDAHLQRVQGIRQLRPYSSVIVEVVVAGNPKVIRGRHVIFPVKDRDGQVDCAAFEPTGALSKAAKELIQGDSLRVYGSVQTRPLKGLLTINLEKIRLLKLAPILAYSNPICPQCSKHMKSMGRNKGFRCERCGLRDDKATKVPIRIRRRINRGLYLASARSQRHLTKPFVRYGMEKRRCNSVALTEQWHFP
jgi:tRNA(Ile2)-agmatinylcytidine synthase